MHLPWGRHEPDDRVRDRAGGHGDAHDPGPDRADDAATGAVPDAASGRVPSPEATERLAGALRRELDDLRDGLTDDLLLMLLLAGEDDVDEAAAMLDEGAARLHRFHGRVEDAIADAAVEREAEAVVAAVDAGGDDVAERRVTRIRMVASAAAAVVAAIVGLASLTPPVATDGVNARSSAAGSRLVGDAALFDRPGEAVAGPRGRDVVLAGGSATGSVPSTAPAVRPGPRAAEPAPTTDRERATTALLGVDRFVAELVADAGATVADAVADVGLPPRPDRQLASSVPSRPLLLAEEPAEAPPGPATDAGPSPTAVDSSDGSVERSDATDDAVDDGDEPALGPWPTTSDDEAPPTPSVVDLGVGPYPERSGLVP